MNNKIVYYIHILCLYTSLFVTNAKGSTYFAWFETNKFFGFLHGLFLRNCCIGMLQELSYAIKKIKYKNYINVAELNRDKSLVCVCIGGGKSVLCLVHQPGNVHNCY